MDSSGEVNIEGHGRLIGPASGYVAGDVNTTYTNIYQSVQPQPIDVATLEAAQQRLATLPLDTIPAPAALPTPHRMPLSRNPLFVGREEDLKSLAAAIKAGGTTAIGQLAAVAGLGGIGKTQLASEFVHRYGQYFQGGVFWLSFADAANVPAEIASSAGPGGLEVRADYASLPLIDQVRLVLAAWESELPRLLVFDNCEDESLLDQWRPKTGGCRVLVTSRRAQWAAGLGVQTQFLGVLDRLESIALLRKHRPDLPPDDLTLDAIAKEVGDLPLALHLAGSFLAQYRHAISPAEYLEQLRRPDLLHHRSLTGGGISPTRHEQHVGRTFALSYDRLDPAVPTDALALKLLARVVHFAPGEPVPRAQLLATIKHNQEIDLFQFEDALRRLLDLGLLEEEIQGALSLHRLLSRFIQSTVNDAEAGSVVEEVMLKVATSMNGKGDPRPLLVLQPHLRWITDAAQDRMDERVARLSNVLGEHLYMIGDYAGARPYLERALATQEQVLGEQHPDTALSLNNLGVLLDSIGDLAGARRYYERALAIREQVLGAQHPHTAQSLNNLGHLLQAQGDLAKARSYYEQALAIREQVLGTQHPDTANSLNNVGYLLQAQGDLAKARPYYERALAIREQVLGTQHPDTANTLNNLGALLRAQRDFTGAKRYYERALAIRKQVLGTQHPDTANSLNNLGALLHAQGNLAGAKPYFEQALEICEQRLGLDHLRTRRIRDNLAALNAQLSGTSEGP